jgi:hypothetical protein
MKCTSAIVHLLILLLVSAIATATAVHGEEQEKPIVTPVSQSLTVEERAACLVAIADAQRLGFPELSGAKVVSCQLKFKSGATTGNTAHIHLADGSWLIEETVPVSNASISDSANEVIPHIGEGTEVDKSSAFLPSQCQLRLRGKRLISNFSNDGSELGLAAISWWKSGRDPDGQTVVSAILRNAVSGQDRGTHLHLMGGRGNGTSTRAGEVQVPDMGTGIRRILSSWFRAQIVTAKSDEEAERWKDSSLTICDPADRPLLRPVIERLRQRASLSTVIDERAPLAERLMAWRGEEIDQATWTRLRAPPLPARREDTGALIDLISDDHVCRWIDAMWTPRTVGDNALRALFDLWTIDWRWLTMEDPAVMTLLPRPPGPPGEEQGPYGDTWVWDRGNWTDGMRHACAASLASWWNIHGSGNASHIYAELFRTLPLRMWSEELGWMQQGDRSAEIGDRIAERLDAMPPIREELGYAGVLYRSLGETAFLLPTHVGITASLSKWPASTWLSDLQVIRAGLAGDDKLFDAWMIRTLSDKDENHEWMAGNDKSILRPWLNLGLLAFRPTASRLSALRAALAQSVSVPGARCIIAHLGDSDFPVLGNAQYTKDWRNHAGTRAIPAALAQDGMKDVRALPPKYFSELHDWASLIFGNSKFPDLASCDQPRVCDWVAGRLMLCDDQSFTAWMPTPLRDAKSFLTKPVAERDKNIAQLSQLIEPFVKRMLEDAGLIKRAVGPSDF